MEDATLQRMIDQLRGELEEIRYAIWSLEAIIAGRPRRGRPPKWLLRFTGKRRASPAGRTGRKD